MLSKETIDIQNQLATYCRDGKLVPIEGAKEDRLHNYRRLVFNVICDTLETAYPITNQVLEEGEWDELMFDFFNEHPCQDPQVWRMPKELIGFTESKKYADKWDKPYLIELLWFEWLEVDVHGLDDVELDEKASIKDVWTDELVLNPYIEFVELDYPVHKMKAADLVENKVTSFSSKSGIDNNSSTTFLAGPNKFKLAFHCTLHQHVYNQHSIDFIGTLKYPINSTVTIRSFYR